MGATLELQRLQHVERLEQQMMWAQLAQQASQHAPQVYIDISAFLHGIYVFCFCLVVKFFLCVFSLNKTWLTVTELI